MIVALFVCLAIALVVIARLAAACRASIREQRHTDPLTGLPNLQGFEEIVADHLKRETPFSILWLNLDGFRKINEEHGHLSGDVLLAQIGPRIRRCLRPGDAVARFGGDQFLVLMQGHEGTAVNAARILNKINATAGVSLYPDHAINSSQLLLLAEAAMREAKATSRGKALFYAPSMAATSVRTAQIAVLIESALANNYFRLVYQPIVDANGSIVRMEALVRIEDPVLGRVAPVEFIGVAEETGLMFKVGIWILDQACRQACEWREAGLKARVTINLSPLQMASDELADVIINKIAWSGIQTSAITVHITGEVKSASAVERLRAAGIVVSAQDAMFDEIRVSEPFDVPVSASELTVIGRGIETPEQLDRAQAAGCDLFQGYQIAPPLEAGDATEILRSGLFAGFRGIVRR